MSSNLNIVIFTNKFDKLPVFGRTLVTIRQEFFPDRPFLFSPKLRGDGVAPVSLTETRKEEIEFEFQEKMDPDVWAPRDLADGS